MEPTMWTKLESFKHGRTSKIDFCFKEHNTFHLFNTINGLDLFLSSHWNCLDINFLDWKLILLRLHRFVDRRVLKRGLGVDARRQYTYIHRSPCTRTRIQRFQHSKFQLKLNSRMLSFALFDVLFFCDYVIA